MIDLNGVVSKESGFTDTGIWNMQKLFLTQLFSNKKLVKFLPLVLDLATYHQQYAEVLQSSISEATKPSKIPQNLCMASYRLAASVHIITFKYDIEELLDCGEPRIAWMYKSFHQTGTQAVMYLRDGMVCTESLAAPYILLLEQIRTNDGK